MDIYLNIKTYKEVQNKEKIIQEKNVLCLNHIPIEFARIKKQVKSPPSPHIVSKINPHLNIYKRDAERENEEKNISKKQHPGVLKKGREKRKKDEKMGLTKGGGFDIMAKLT